MARIQDNGMYSRHFSVVSVFAHRTVAAGVTAVHPSRLLPLGGPHVVRSRVCGKSHSQAAGCKPAEFRGGMYGTRPMIEMAIVGLGSWGLCVMERTVSRARRAGTPMRLHVVEPSQLGGGVYAAEQPDFLVLNNACGQLSLYAAPDGDG